MPTSPPPRARSFAERLDARLDAIAAAAVELGRFLADIGIFTGTIVLVWGVTAWLGYSLDKILGTAPHVSLVAGQSGPFAMLGVISGMVLSLFAANWVSNERRRRRGR